MSQHAPPPFVQQPSQNVCIWQVPRLCLPQGDHAYCTHGRIMHHRKGGTPHAGGLRAVTEVLQLIGGATLAVQTVVLGASLFQKAKQQQKRAPDQGKASDPSPAGSSSSQPAGSDPRVASLSSTGAS